jgi:hypothetical protein
MEQSTNVPTVVMSVTTVLFRNQRGVRPTWKTPMKLSSVGLMGIRRVVMVFRISFGVRASENIQIMGATQKKAASDKTTKKLILVKRFLSLWLVQSAIVMLYSSWGERRNWKNETTNIIANKKRDMAEAYPSLKSRKPLS